jgi:hypothetical protein
MNWATNCTNSFYQAFWLADLGSDPEEKDTDKDGDTRMSGS